MFVNSSKDQNFVHMEMMDDQDILINFDSVGGNWRALNGDKDEIERVINPPKPIIKETSKEPLQKKLIESEEEQESFTEAKNINQAV